MTYKAICPKCQARLPRRWLRLRACPACGVRVEQVARFATVPVISGGLASGLIALLVIFLLFKAGFRLERAVFSALAVVPACSTAFLYVADPYYHLYRLAGSVCRKCGYDLRASFERCPECETPIPDNMERPTLK